MESSEQRLINDDAAQAPLLANDGNDDNSYRIEPSTHERKDLL
jgi:hypothetical protein